MSETATATLDMQTVRRFALSFARCRRPHILETPTGWLTRHGDLTDTMIAAHLSGAATCGVKVARRRGRAWEAVNLALEVDFGSGERPAEEALADILGYPGAQVAEAILEAGRQRGIPETAWCLCWSGGRSLHAWLILKDPVELAAAHRVAQGLHAAIDDLLIGSGLSVCHSWPTNGDGETAGMGIRLPCGRHQGSGLTGRFLTWRDGKLHLRPPFAEDIPYLATLEVLRRVEPEVILSAAQVATPTPSRRRPRPAERQEPRPKVREEATGDGAVERVLPTQARRLARPCILRLLEIGVPEGLRHDMALLLRAELVHCGLTLEEAWPCYRRFAAACSPPWPEAEAWTDLTANWSVTDPARRHVCPERGDPSSLTQELHRRLCIGAEACGWRRAGAVLTAWRTHLSADARTLYEDLAIMEADLRLRPGDGIHTTDLKLQQRTGLSRRYFKPAREELEGTGLLRRDVTGKLDGIGTPGGGVHTVYVRTIPPPDPPENTAG